MISAVRHVLSFFNLFTPGLYPISLWLMTVDDKFINKRRPAKIGRVLAAFGVHKQAVTLILF
jgi:hypothetical protein